MYFKLIFLPILSILINILKFIWVPIVYNYRNRAREVVYNYWLSNGIAFHLPNGITYNTKFYFLKNEVFLTKENVSKTKYKFYLYVVWIWFDDTMTADVIDNRVMLEIFTNTWLFNKYKSEANTLQRKSKGSSFMFFNVNKPIYNTTPSVGILYLSLLYNSNTNFKNLFFYSIDKQSRLGIGYTKPTFINGNKFYKYTLWG